MDFLNHPRTDWIIEQALLEDLGQGVARGDHTSLATLNIQDERRAQAVAKAPGIAAGLGFAQKVFEKVDKRVQFSSQISEGQPIAPGDVLFAVEGSARSLLTAERLALNALQRMSGIATATRQAVDRIAHTPCRVLDTRKTTPLVRHLEKWAVKIGGGQNHRMGLFDMILIKDNHIDFAGGIPQALQLTQEYLQREGLNLPVEIETRTTAEVQAVLQQGGANRILLDNMSTQDLKACVDLIVGRTETEASGGVTLDTVQAIAETGVDYVSMGGLTHSYTSLDISMKAY